MGLLSFWACWKCAVLAMAPDVHTALLTAVLH